MAEEPIISLRNVSKTYRAYDHPLHRLIARISGGRVGHCKEFHALNDVSFDIHKGETVGIIGRNGSGKSTLLQIICGIRQPTSGSVNVKGRISALLELGSGFQPEFTGRENVFLQGAIMGFSREMMETLFDDIASFADIGEYIDQPVKTYSSGMFVRLAFAVAISVDPDILVVDEALAVGDGRFQSKCFRKIQQLCDRGGSILFVTHATDQVTRFCNRAMLIEQGCLAQSGAPKEVVNRHIASLFESPHQIGDMQTSRPASTFASRPGYNPGEYRFGNGVAEITDYRFVPAEEGAITLRFAGNQKVTLTLRVVFHREVARATFALSISTPDGMVLFGVNSRDIQGRSCATHFMAGEMVEASFTLSLNLARGDYLISLSVSEEMGNHLEALDRRYDAIYLSVDNPLNQRGIVDLMPVFSTSAITAASEDSKS